ncbi:hypothetical protein Bbelb_354660 [Branchiostoma belcheri]|nr:hypothetical protein Bbelb_354660 [Branchiostoma belcheri]
MVIHLRHDLEYNMWNACCIPKRVLRPPRYLGFHMCSLYAETEISRFSGIPYMDASLSRVSREHGSNFFTRADRRQASGGDKPHIQPEVDDGTGRGGANGHRRTRRRRRGDREEAAGGVEVRVQQTVTACPSDTAHNYASAVYWRQRLVHPKDRPHKGTKANVIYRLKCEEPNCKHTYIGETSRPLKVRYKEHCRPSANGYSSAIFHHLQHNQGHSFKLESTDVLDRETRCGNGVEGGLRVDLSGTWDLALPAPRTDNT